MSPLFFLGATTLICLGVFLTGLRFSRMTSSPFSGADGSELVAPPQIRSIGRLFMIAAPAFWLVAAAFVLSGALDGALEAH
jgi:hypothetical protein